LNDGWHPDIFSSWEKQGCYDDIEAQLSYRFSLKNIVTTQTVSPGGILEMSFTIENDGFAAPVNERIACDCHTLLLQEITKLAFGCQIRNPA